MRAERLLFRLAIPASTVAFASASGSAPANHWEQSFSYDDGVTWRTNWISEGTQLR